MGGHAWRPPRLCLLPGHVSGTRGAWAAGPRWRHGRCANAHSWPRLCGSPGDRPARGSCTKRAEACHPEGRPGAGVGGHFAEGNQWVGSSLGAALAGWARDSDLWGGCGIGVLRPRAQAHPCPTVPSHRGRRALAAEPGRAAGGTTLAGLCFLGAAQRALVLSSSHLSRSGGCCLVTCTAPPGRRGVVSGRGLCPVSEGSGGHSG